MSDLAVTKTTNALGWRFTASGALSQAPAPSLDLLLEPDAAQDLGLENLLSLSAIGLVFKTPHDGRGFSLARQLRNAGFHGQLIGLGRLMPDQARHALQSGLDGLWLEEDLVRRHGEEAWQNALKVVVPSLYVGQSLSGDVATRLAAPDIWQRRQTKAA